MEDLEAGGLVLDSDVLISDLRGKSSFLRDLEDRDPATTVINAFELFHGAYRSRESSANLSAARGLLDGLRVLSLGPRAAEKAGEVLAHAQKSGETMEIRDLLVGCIAREEGLSLLTFNTKHFRRIPGLNVLDAGELTRVG